MNGARWIEFRGVEDLPMILNHFHLCFEFVPKRGEGYANEIGEKI